LYIDALQSGIDITTDEWSLTSCDVPNFDNITALGGLLSFGSITGLTGGTATDLDSIPTEGLPDASIVSVIRNGGVAFYRLSTATTAEASPTIIRPDDYAASNTRIWTLMLTDTRGLLLDATITATIGAVTIHKYAGTANIAAGASTVVVTNNLVTANSIILPVLRANDATANYIESAVAGAGSFTITVNANATANLSVGWVVVNPLT
jgi:hypothetical protein